jgi:cephalosporin-C deacetylase-like acetyl esterase
MAQFLKPLIAVAFLCAPSGLVAQEPPPNAGQVDRYLTRIAAQHLRERAARLAAIRTPAQVKERQQYVREKILESLGGLPEMKTPLNPQITGTLERDGYRVEKLVFESLPSFFVTANVYVPTGGNAPFPALIGVAGHSVNGKASAPYQSAWISFARRGILVVAFDPPGQGERLEYLDPDTGLSTVGVGTREHMMAGAQCLLTGTNYARYEIWDGIRAFDYLLTRPDVDPKRIAVAGNSGGGTQSAYLAVAEPRLAVAAPSCYITSWVRLWGQPGPQDAEQNFAGFLAAELDFSDFLIAFAPKPIKVLSAIRDYFPIEGARAAYAEASRLYDIAGAGDRISFFEYEDQHGWSKPRRQATYQWMDKWLLGRDTDGAEGELKLEADVDLEVTTTGQVATSLGGETVQSLNRKLAEQMYSRRTALLFKDPAELRNLVVRRLAAGVERGAPPVKVIGEESLAGLRLERIQILPEEGITLAARILAPSTAAGRRPAVIWLNPLRNSSDLRTGGDVAALAAAGHVVMLLDVRGWEGAESSAGSSGYSRWWQTAMRAMLVGKTMAGMQTYDILRAFDYLATRPDVDPAHIGIWGRSTGGVLALYAAALEPRFRKAAMDGSILSYMDLVRVKRHEEMVDLLVPGVLRDFDLSDLAAAISPRKLWIVDPRTPAGGRLGRDAALAGTAGIPVQFRAEGEPFTQFAAGWLGN